jgi:hypothetical protein
MPSAIHIGHDVWTAPNHRAYVCVVGYYEKEGEPQNVLLAFKEVLEKHTGATLARVVADVVKEYGIEDKVSTQ